ncbi:MAG: hypothetical protein M0Q47_10745 [Methanothrix sp.]|jgi:hypothetical protein|uniref:hypothetical protein n=1 Tax=Methanothrix sp. TaxID=90426 RepID=UPI0025FEC703|nr:hypothetical protein [Methanothrix sp.]MCK9406870.1 hypothetical protein [Methanothrix sp.]
MGIKIKDKTPEEVARIRIMGGNKWEELLKKASATPLQEVLQTFCNPGDEIHILRFFL